MQVDSLAKDECCGCQACVDVCPKQCITMQKDSELFIYPEINHDLCIDCELCLKVCPSQSQKSFDIKKAISYAAINKQSDVRHNSSSGGVFYQIAKAILSSNGVVYGAAFTDDWSVQHIRVDKIEQLPLIQKSKYLQSDLKGIYTKIRKDLAEGKKVLFSGTPCQVMGLKNMPWAKKKENLICVDIACHAVPSEKSWKSYLSSLEITTSDITHLDFRDKNYPWHNYSLTIKTADGRSISEPCDKNPFMLGFIYNLTDRPSCHNCPAKGLTSGSDIMLADFWGIEKFMPDMDDNKGTSLVIIKSEKGGLIFEEMVSMFKIKKVSNDAFLNRQDTFMKSSGPHYKRAYFFKHVGKKTYKSLIKDCLRHNASFINRIKRRLGLIYK